MAGLCRTETLIVVPDVTDIRSHRVLTDAAFDRFGPLGVLVDNADGGHLAPFVETTSEHLQRTIALNMDATTFLSRCAVEVTKKARWKTIVNVDSVARKMLRTDRTTLACLGSARKPRRQPCQHLRLHLNNVGS